MTPPPLGTELPPLVKPVIERIQLVRYAGASGDFNPIHVDEEFARAAGYPKVFAHGMLVMGFLGQLLADWAGSPTRVMRIACRFRAITWPGDVITCSGRVTAVAAGSVEVSLVAQDERGEVKAEGSATIAQG
jgi:acyl dehydratase